LFVNNIDIVNLWSWLKYVITSESNNSMDYSILIVIEDKRKFFYSVFCNQHFRLCKSAEWNYSFLKTKSIF
jgi:hypothetical protein